MGALAGRVEQLSVEMDELSSVERWAMFGFFNIHKAAGVTSREIVNRVQRAVRMRQCGHAGTLDPLATGVLLVAVGHATRLIEYAQLLPKTYCGEFQLGQASDTEDREGQITTLINPPLPTRAAIEQAFLEFLGDYQQVPPQYSAKWVDGKRSHELARSGQAVALSARAVTIHTIDLLEYEYPRLVLRIRCGSGTYIRSLGRDLARACGTEAVMTGLVREAIGPFRVETAVSPEEINPRVPAEHLLPVEMAVSGLPAIRLPEEQLEDVRHGRFIKLPETVAVTANVMSEAEICENSIALCAAYTADDKLRAILVRRADGTWRAQKNFFRPLT